MAEVYLAAHCELHVTASIGMSVYPEDGLDVETLIKNADTAMYRAKKNGRQSCRVLQAEMKSPTFEREPTKRTCNAPWNGTN